MKIKLLILLVMSLMVPVPGVAQAEKETRPVYPKFVLSLVYGLDGQSNGGPQPEYNDLLGSLYQTMNWFGFDLQYYPFKHWGITANMNKCYYEDESPNYKPPISCFKFNYGFIVGTHDNNYRCSSVRTYPAVGVEYRTVHRRLEISASLAWCVLYYRPNNVIVTAKELDSNVLRDLSVSVHSHNVNYLWPRIKLGFNLNKYESFGLGIGYMQPLNKIYATSE